MDKYTVLVFKNLDLEDLENTMTPKNIEVIMQDKEHIVIGATDGIQDENGVMQIQYFIHGDNYEKMSRIYMLMANLTYERFIESKQKEKKRNTKSLLQT